MVDIAGGNGTVVRHLIDRHPHLQTVVFERQTVIDAALKNMKSANKSIRFVPGDLFDSKSFERVATADAIILKRILHDWGDEECVKILRNARTIMHNRSRLFIVDFVIEDSCPDGLLVPKLVSDLSMLAMVNGRERTRTGFVELLKRSGLRLTKINNVVPMASIIEAQLP